jgi:SAM-dependent methyltransferase
MERTTVRATIDVALDAAAAFEVLVDELALALAPSELTLAPGPSGHVAEGGRSVGRVLAWEPGRRIVLEWRPADWQPEERTEVELSFEPTDAGTRVTLEHRGWGSLLGDRSGEAAGWFASEVVAPLLRATAPDRLTDWLTDRAARRPSGTRARETYRDPVHHRPNFAVLLALLSPGPEDHLLEIGCGGGVLLHDALERGCRAAAIDHSPDMVRLAREVNAGAVAAGRLDVVEASANDPLPFADETFTCATMTGVLGFLAEPVATLSEVRRVLVSGGRLAVLGSDPEARGTPAAPEPYATRIRFYGDEELAELGRSAGFVDVRVERHSLEPYAREAGVPEEHLSLFAGDGPRFLVARKA